MSTISVTLPSDGQTADAADYNVPINTIVSEINGSLNSQNIAASGVVPNNLTSGTGTSWSWQTWTVTWTNLTVGNGTVVENKFVQIGKTVFARYRFTFGSTSSMGSSPTFTLPVTATTYSTLSFTSPIGQLTILDSGTVVNNGVITMESTTSGGMQVYGAAASFVNQAGITSTVPMTWTTNDSFSFYIIYEAA